MSEKPCEHYPQLLVIRGKAAFGVGSVTMHSLPADAPAWLLREIAFELSTSSDRGSGFLGVHLAFSPDRGLRFNGKGEVAVAPAPPRSQYTCAPLWNGLSSGA